MRDRDRDRWGQTGRAGLSRRQALTSALAALATSRAAFAQDIKNIRIGAGPAGGTDFLFGGLIGNAISNPPGSRECEKGGKCGVPGLIAGAQTTTGAVANLQGVARGDFELSLCQADAASWGYSGTGPFAGKDALTRLRVIARVYPATIHLVTRADSKIKGISGLKGKRVGIGEQGAATAATPKVILSAFGIHWDTVRLRYLDFTAIPDALATGTIDAMFMIGGVPVLALEDLARRVPIRVLPIDGPIAEKIADVLPFYSIGVVPAGTYGSPADVPTLDVGTVLVARDTMDDALAFGIAQAIWHERNLAYFQNGHPSGKLMDRTQAALGIGMPLHPGAARFYFSQGVMMAPDAPPAYLRGGAPGART